MPGRHSCTDANVASAQKAQAQCLRRSSSLHLWISSEGSMQAEGTVAVRERKNWAGDGNAEQALDI